MGWELRGGQTVVTMQDVAKAAGVSLMTVSNVVNGHSNVGSATRERVLLAIDELGYRVNVAARNLRIGKTGTIGLAIPGLDSQYFCQLAIRIIEHAGAAGYRVAVEQTGSSREHELAALAYSRNRAYDGLIISVARLSAADRDLLRVDFPAVVLGERLFDGPLDHVAMANVDGGRAATQHLMERGRRRIGIIATRGGSEPGAGGLRLQGHQAALEEAGLPADPQLHVYPRAVSVPAGRDALLQLLDRASDIDAVFCMTDSIAIGALRGLADAGRKVPDDVMVIGFDDILEASFTVPSLSTVDPGHDFMAKTAVSMIVDRIRNEGEPAPPREVISDVRLVARESTSGSGAV